MSQAQSQFLGQYIDEQLKKKSWSRRRLARETGFSASHINNIVRDFDNNTGKAPIIGVHILIAIAKALNIPYQNLTSRLHGIVPTSLQHTSDSAMNNTETTLHNVLNRLRELYPNELELEEKLNILVKSDDFKRLLQIN